MLNTWEKNKQEDYEIKILIFSERSLTRSLLPITRSLHTNPTLESTLSRIFLFLELRYEGFFNFSLEHAYVRISP